MDMEPFINTNAHSTGGAYPHPSSRPLTPFEPEVYYSVDENSTTGMLRIPRYRVS